MEQFINLVEKVQRGNRFVANAIETIGVAAILLIMTITCADVIGTKAFLHPVPGSLDIVMLAQSIAISFCTAATLIAGGHVSVDFFLRHMPPLLSRIIALVIGMLSLFLFILITWQMAVYGHELWSYQEVSPTARISLYPYAYGVALAMVPACIEMLARLIKTAAGRETEM